jgi:S-layer homology domain
MDTQTKKFGVNDMITKAQASAMIANALNLDTQNVNKPGFSDVSSNHWAYGAIAAVTNNRLLSKGAKFYPSALTRAEMAKAVVIGYGIPANTSRTFKD